MDTEPAATVDCQPTDVRSVKTADVVATRHLHQTDEADRKSRGQFFTPSIVADFMAALFMQIPPSCRVLDAGAGVGALTAAVCDRLTKEPHINAVNVVAYEIDVTGVSYLEQTLADCRRSAETSGCSFSSEIRVTDFIADVAARGRSLFAESQCQFDLAIMNPPYFKLRADSEHAKLAREIGPTQPNIYSLFMAAAIEWLRPGGELVAITPRSFCNGLYFREFRRWLFDRMDLLQIHSFRSRTETFREANVLQESVISHFRRRGTDKGGRPSIMVSRSAGRDFTQIVTDRMARRRVIDDSSGDDLICIPERSQDAEILEIAESWPGRFLDTGLRISTGPVVMFRTREFHVHRPKNEDVPLLSAHHLRNGRVIWPREKKKWPSAFHAGEESRKHLVPTRNYVIVKRFSAKEERRRLSAGVLRAADFSTPHLAIENHVNYLYHGDRELTIEEATGLTALFNSALMDRYFRTFSGNTQVNATEVRTMKFPNLQTIEAIGRRAISKDGIDPEIVVLESLSIDGRIKDYLAEFRR